MTSLVKCLYLEISISFALFRYWYFGGFILNKAGKMFVPVLFSPCLPTLSMNLKTGLTMSGNQYVFCLCVGK